MRGLIVLCFSAVALAAPQGYNYNPAHGGTGGLSLGGQGGSLHGSGASFTGFSGASSLGGSSGFAGGFGSGSNVGPTFTAGAGSGGIFQSGQQGGYASKSGGDYHGQQEAIVTKRFFVHSAPEEHDEDYKERHITVGVPKKNYNVVFIKAPAKSSKKTTLKITPAINEEKTVVYVLTKKGDASDINTEVLEQPTQTAKPEVFFIKYKTPEEAVHAQEQIQAQYDALGGSSQITDEGVAPVTSVIGALGNSGSAGGAGSHGGAASVGGGYATAGASFGGATASVPSYTGATGVSASGPRGGNAYLPPAFH